ncbi:MAG: DNA mismatch repair protein MutS [Marinilabiliaceae bacterium]|nr:DNA mismatch repair protein MutS [Marinilabiliaceae bacterium]
MKSQSTETPLMRQYNQIKAKHPDAILLFRMGDFYETFYDDAVKVSEVLGITLTTRNNGAAASAALAGFPHHAIDTYLPKLVHAGLRVAVCDQLEDPRFAKGLVKRGITELVTPGVAIGDNVLENRENNFLACVNMQTGVVGVAFLDLSTGEFMMSEGRAEDIDRLLATFKPKEVLFEKGKRQQFVELFGNKWLTYPFDDWAFDSTSAVERLTKHFETLSLKGFGVQGMQYGVTAAGAIMQYLDVTQHDHTSHIRTLSRIESDRYVWLDKFTIRNLELLPSGVDGSKSLIDIIDKTITPMGSRMLKRWVVLPLKDKPTIDARLDSVAELIDNSNAADTLRDSLSVVGDMERLVGKVAAGRVSPREMIQLKKTLYAIEPLIDTFANSKSEHLRRLTSSIDKCLDVRNRIEKTIMAEPSATIAKGNVIATGVNAELDDLRSISLTSRDYIANMQAELIEQTGISSLKINFNNVFGYYIEVRNTYKDKVPDTWMRKQTLANAERYITEELKEYEEKILHADERSLTLEMEIYNELLYTLLNYMAPLQHDAQVLSELDVLLAFAANAIENNYCRPEITTSDELKITQGRHPVIERILPAGEPYIANDVELDCAHQQIIIVTGPNMAGKSALLRQTALIVLMAQIGSFVPAQAAQVGVVDKIFTRVGASDNISQGESTFMVEMTEAANILNNVTPRSLVLFDELGRGTSTYDGISLAWSIVEYLHEQPSARAKTLFATHYHELNDMEQKMDRIHNFNVAVREVNGKIVFMRKLERGGSAHSFGIHVAKLAGMPRTVVNRANEILASLEANRNSVEADTTQIDAPSGMQYSIFQLDDPVLSEVRRQIVGIDINNLTPLEALNKLSDIKNLLGIKN